MDNINNNTPIQPNERTPWERFTEGAKKTHATIASAARKALSFFQKGLVGKAIKKAVAPSITEAAVSQTAAILAASHARSLGLAAGSLALGPAFVLSTVAVSAASLAAANPTSAAKLFQHFRELSGLKGIATVLGLFALIALYFHYAKDLEEIGQNLGAALFEKLGSLIASIITGYQVARLSSGLSFQEYLQRKLQQAGAVTVFNAAFKPNPWVKIPWNLAVEIFAYNAAPIRDFMKIVHKCITTRQGDLATKIKNYISALQEAELKVARAQREAARARGETNLTPHDTRIRKLENQPTATKAVLKNLDKLIRSGFKSFLKYQEMLTSSDTIAAAQEEFIETYRRAKLFENAERTGGIESTDEYRQALQANPEIAQNPNGFKNECLARHTSEQTRVKNNFARALGNAVRKKLNIGSRLLNQVAGSRLSNLVLPHLDTLPEINELEYILTGCRLTNPVDASISRELISIHLQHFLAISAAPIVSEAAVAVAREVTRQAPTEAEPLDRNTDLELIEGLLKLTLNHYSRSLPNSTIIGMVDKALPFIFTSLREGIKSAISEWYTRNQEPVIVEHEEIEDDDFFDAVEQLEPTNPEIPEDDGVGAEEIDAGWVEILTNEEDDDFFDAVEQLEPTNPEIPEDDGVGAEEIDAGWVEILTNKEDDDIAFPSQEEIDEAAPAQPAEPSEEDDGLGRSLPIEALDDIDFLTQEEIDEAVRATPAQPANSSKAGKLFRKFFKN